MVGPFQRKPAALEPWPLVNASCLANQAMRVGRTVILLMFSFPCSAEEHFKSKQKSILIDMCLRISKSILHSSEVPIGSYVTVFLSVGILSTPPCFCLVCVGLILRAVGQPGQGGKKVKRFPNWKDRFSPSSRSNNMSVRTQYV